MNDRECWISVYYLLNVIIYNGDWVNCICPDYTIWEKNLPRFEPATPRFECVKNYSTIMVLCVNFWLMPKISIKQITVFIMSQNLNELNENFSLIRGFKWFNFEL